MKVLLVEDDPNLREGMGELLSELAEVRMVGQVREALAALREERFELVLTDLRISGDAQGGRTIVEAAQKQQQPVAIVSAAAAEEMTKLLLPFHADAMLSKPFQLEDILALVERFLALRTEAERWAKAPPPAGSAWAEVATGVQVAPAPPAQVPGSPTWVRMQAGASHAWAIRQSGEGILLVEGDVEVGGERRPAPHYFFLSAGGPREVHTGAGCLAVSLAWNR
ncbi:response regulator [Stigmatella aurantiaca]|uniref:Response regulator n=1 Tax=Stigmatella aurantiaca (strain DW4/3-1) TaxID=378806 RepID=Q08T19_STIAD|nr:response regulator [Stigmatella aurantiaca]ADO72019.1 Response regulator [Stigmatella aurantiaca DW4/3-1]EAU63620.1 response regulator FleR, putative [Stigmatella aurantiaca DW4/3-1]